ncbi:MAG: hypothetical protein ACN6QH_17865 [Pseudomonas sp.]|uniref:hypothetical protein n=1 Tax=Pseudomonas sp. TaxID=306 RepID=UPI003D0ADEC4
MFEIIGVCVACLIIWRLIKKILDIVSRKTLTNAVRYAIKQDVPYSFAVNLVNNPRIMIECRKALRGKTGFSELDAHEQYGLAIVMAFEGAKQESNTDYYDGKDSSVAYEDTMALAIELGVPSRLFEQIFVNNIDNIREFAFQIDQPGEPHHGSSFETRMAVATNTLYRASLKNPGLLKGIN